MFWVRMVVAVVTVAGLGWAAKDAVRQLTASPPVWSQVNWFGLAMCVLIVGLSQLLAGFFWHRVLAGFGYVVPLARSLMAFSCSQFGKYVPGKALVVLVRTGMIARAGVPVPIGVASVFVETLLWVSVGATVGSVALAVADIGFVWLNNLAVGMAVVFGILTTPFVFGKITERIFAKLGVEAAARATRPSWRTWSIGSLLLTAGWLLAGWAMLIVVDSVGPQASEWRHFAICLAAASLATVVGFVTLIPGGLGVRELVILPVLSTAFPPAQALVAAIIFRLISMSAELLMVSIVSAISYTSRLKQGWEQAP